MRGMAHLFNQVRDDGLTGLVGSLVKRAQCFARQPRPELCEADPIDRHRLVTGGDDAAEVAEHLLHEIDRLQLRRVAVEQDRVAGEDVAEMLQLPHHQFELFGDALLEHGIGAAGARRWRLEQAAAPGLDLGPDRSLGSSTAR